MLQRKPPWYLVVPALGSATAVAVPLIYLLIRALQSDAATVAADLLRPHTFQLLVHTIGLTIGVLAFTIVLALPIAWLTTQSDLPARGLFSLVGVLPLAVPGYILAYAILGVGGYGGPWFVLSGRTVSAPRGYWGSLLALGIYNTPYMYLNLRAVLRELDPAVEEAGRSLGHGRLRVFVSVVLPQLRPAILSGALLVSLHVIGDFGVVSLMQYETFSLALYTAFTSSARGTVDAAAPALVLIVLAVLILTVDIWCLRRLTLYRASARPRSWPATTALGRWKLPTALALAALGLVTVVAPTGMVIFWSLQEPMLSVSHKILPALLCSLAISLPTALAATLLAIPVAMLARRYPSARSVVLERLAFVGYAIPSLAFALSIIFLAVRIEAALGWDIYPGLVLLIAAYAIYFLAEAVGPIRSGLYLATPRLEEASRVLGVGRMATMWRITLPVLRNSLIVSVALVFLSAMKELPIAIMLKPYGFDTLSIKVWDYSEEAGFAEAAPFALCILLCSAAFVGVLLAVERRPT